MGCRSLHRALIWNAISLMSFTLCSTASSAVRLREHADQTSLTLLIQDVREGLQIWDSAHGEWLDAKVSADSTAHSAHFLCNTGDFMELWTNQKYKSTLHRIVGSSDLQSQSQGRVSVVFFCFPNHDAVIETISQCVDASRGDKVTRTVCADEL